MAKRGGISEPHGGGGTACVAPLFSRSSRGPAPTSLREQRERTLGAIGRARRGDRDALSYVYRQYAPGVFAYVRRMLRNDYDAQDVTQQVFVKLATSLDKYDPQRADFSAWVLRMAHNAAVDHLRKHRLTLLTDPVEVPPEVDEPDPDNGRSLREAFGALSGAQRDVLLLREVVGLTPREVAKRLGKTQAAVNTCHHRARLAAVRSLISLESTPATRSAGAQRAAWIRSATPRPN
jgi:RNA polymerase sigma-70 factor, ECF subfamily